jgi:hypothetical protein
MRSKAVLFCLLPLTLFSLFLMTSASDAETDLERARSYLKDMIAKVDSGTYVLRPLEIGDGTAVPFPVRVEEYDGSITYALAVGKITRQVAERLRREREAYTKLHRDGLKMQLSRLEDQLRDARGVSSGCSNIAGRWLNVIPEGSSTWHIRSDNAGRLQADESGMGNAKSTSVTFSGSKLRIDWVSGGIKGYYEWELDPNCQQSISGTLVWTQGLSGTRKSTLKRQ